VKANDTERRKELATENGRLKWIVADLSLDNAILKEVAKGNFGKYPPSTPEHISSGSTLTVL